MTCTFTAGDGGVAGTGVSARPSVLLAQGQLFPLSLHVQELDRISHRSLATQAPAGTTR